MSDLTEDDKAILVELLRERSLPTVSLVATGPQPTGNPRETRATSAATGADAAAEAAGRAQHGAGPDATAVKAREEINVDL